MSLLERVRELFRRQEPLAKDAKGEPADLEIKAAAAVLLLEAAFGDEEYVWREEHVLGARTGARIRHRAEGDA